MGVSPTLSFLLVVQLAVSMVSALPLMEREMANEGVEGWEVDMRVNFRAEKPKKLVFQDLNFVQLTDVHSWLSGHMHEKGEDAAYPDVMAFVQHLKANAAAEGKDLFLFNSGDIVDGTGLSDATKVRGVMITPIIQQMPFTALTSGNHELYHDDTVGNLVHSGFVDSWKGRYLTANIHNTTTGETIGTPYTVVNGPHGTKLVVLGFLFNMQNHCESVTVTPVAQALKEQWFTEAMIAADDAHAIVVLVHMDVRDPLTHTILAEIRRVKPKKPVVFLAGHTHYRGYATFDSHAVSLESGKYLDTIGFISCKLPETLMGAMTCEHSYVDPHVPTMMMLAETDKASFETPESAKMRADVAAIRANLHLDEVIGCSPRDFLPWAPLDDPQSMWKLYMDEVLPNALFTPSENPVFVGGTGALRYSLFHGHVHLDDTYEVSPFKDEYFIARGLKGSLIQKILKIVLAKEVDLSTARTSDLEWVASGDIDPWVSSISIDDISPMKIYELVWVEFDSAVIKPALMKANNGEYDVKIEGFRVGERDSRNVWEFFVRSQWPCSAAKNL